MVPLSNGNYVIVSPSWRNGAVADAGAVTWGNGASGTTGVVSSANSLVGTRTGDNVGYGGNYPGVVPLANGNYVVVSYIWDSPSVSGAGAVTWANGATGRSGIVSAANSLIGSSTDDWVGFGGVTALSNGNYVVASPYWDNGAAWDAGAVTWGNGATGRVGTISVANSLVGDTGGDAVGWYGGVALPNGNYLARSPNWHQHRGAVTWGNGATGIVGVVSAANSLVGSSLSDSVGKETYDFNAKNLGVTVLSNGNYVVSSPDWDKTYVSEPDFGAVTWGNGATGITGEVSAANSLIGSSPYDKVGLLREGNPYTGITALSGVIPLSNGNFVVASGYWDNGAVADTGAITWVNGTTGATGAVTAANSLVGTSNNDRLGQGGVTALANGHFVVASPFWDNGAVSDVGAVTWVSGAASVTGVVSAANSLVGSNNYDLVGSDGVTALANGNYVVRSHFWSDLAAGKAELGAVTWGSGVSGLQGAVSAANSLLGSSDADWVGAEPLSFLSNGDYIVRSPAWDNGAAADAGAVTWGFGGSGTAGVIGSDNSVLGATANQGNTMNFQAANNNLRIVVGRDVDQIVTVVERGPRLIVRLEGTGSGVVSSTPAGIACGSDCAESFSHGTVVTLTAAPAAGSTFAGWTGACTGTGACTVTMDGAKTVTATFAANTYALTVTLAGNGSGSVSSTPAGIACGSDCAESFSQGTVVTLTAAPASGSTFAGWTGACTGTGACTVTMDGAKTVTATFAAITYALTVTLSGTGSGSVSSTPAGIACGADCAESFSQGTVVTLTATPGTGSTFTGWTGACAGTGTCTVTMNGARSVTATFAANTYALSVTRAGNGSGTVSSTPAGIACGADCAESFSHGTVVTLAATPGTGSTFNGWTGACTGTGACTVTMDGAKSVTATFTRVPSVQHSLFLPLVQRW